jgi:formylglycine-generating enzyme required for sulfatase activity
VTVPAQSAVTIGAVVITQIDAQPVHPVASLASFELGKTELTYGVWYLVYQWAVVHGYSLSAGKDSNSQTGGAANAKLPVVMIAWHDAIVWCNALSELKGLRPVYYSDVGQTTVIRSVDALSSPGSSNDPYLDKTSGGYHLPTEAQWESAARYVDGVITAADDLASGAATASSADFDTVGWFAPTNSTVQLVGLKLANPLGLFDMSGNVSEFCQDWFGAYTLSSPYIDADTWGPTTGTERVFRGASTTGIDSLSSQLMYGATTYRWKVLPTFTPNSPSEQRGFRVARNP